MSLVIKRIGNKEYAYLAYRVGKKVVQKYLGPRGGTAAEAALASLTSKRRVPRDLAPFFWDTDWQTLDTKSHARYVIERILEMGDMTAFQWLQRIYAAGRIIEIVMTSRKLSPKSKRFWKVWYEIDDAH